MELVLRLLLILSSRALAGVSVHSEQPAITHGATTWTTESTDHEPSETQFGDIKLVPYNDDMMRVMLYYGTRQHGSDWGEICADNPGNYQERIAKVICQQYGRTDGHFFTVNSTATAPVWLYNVNCDDESSAPHHILRCQHHTTSDQMCTKYLAVKCSDTKLTDSGSRYSGQVFLCPPDGFTQHQSVSAGLVMVYLYESWQTVNVMSEDGNFSDFLDSLCRQLGYSSAVINSGTTVRALSARYRFESCYNSNPLATSSWLTTDQLNCGGSAVACSSCCYKYPTSNCDSKDCDRMNDLVVSCTFNTLSKTPPSEGNSHVCAFHSNTTGSLLNSAECPQTTETRVSPTEIPLRTFEIVIGVVGPLALIFGLLAIIGFCCCCICWWRGRQPQDPPLVRPNDDPGN